MLWKTCPIPNRFSTAKEFSRSAVICCQAMWSSPLRIVYESSGPLQLIFVSLSTGRHSFSSRSVTETFIFRFSVAHSCYCFSFPIQELAVLPKKLYHPLHHEANNDRPFPCGPRVHGFGSRFHYFAPGSDAWIRYGGGLRPASVQ